MADYIVCRKKRNNPRMDVRICEKRCPLKEECEDFQAHHEIPSPKNEIAPIPPPPSIELEAA
jgi:hypothetical protein